MVCVCVCLLWKEDRIEILSFSEGQSALTGYSPVLGNQFIEMEDLIHMGRPSLPKPNYSHSGFQPS